MPADHAAPRPRSATWWAAVACLAALLGWTVGPIFIKYLSASFDVWSQNFFRYVSACLVWLPALVLALRRGHVERGLWWKALIPAVPNVLMQTCWTAAVYFISPPLMSLLGKLSVLWIALFSMALFPDERPLLRRPAFWAGAGLSAAGVLGVILSGPGFTARATATGIVLSLLEGFLWAVYVVAAKRVYRRTDSRVAFSLNAIYTMAGLGLAFALFGRPCVELPRTAGPWLAIVVSGVASIALSHTLYYAAMKRIGATVPALFMLSTPFTVLLLSRAVYGDTLAPAQTLWGLALVAGAAFSILSQRGLPARGEDAP